MQEQDYKETRPFGYWSIEENRAKEAAKYKTRAEFVRNCASAYNKCTKEELLKYFGPGNNVNYKPNNYWDSKINRKKAARECTSRNDFHLKYTQAYNKSSKEELIEYFGEQLSLEKRYIYSYEFINKTIYIGLTSNLKERHLAHLHKKGTVFDYIQKTKETPVYRILTNNPIDSKDVGELEDFIIEEYRSLGYNILNKVKGGGLGAVVYKYTEEELLESALKYNRRVDFYRDNKNHYQACQKMKILSKACFHMLTPEQRAFNKHKNIASKYNNRKEYRINSPYSYSFSSSKKWLNIFFPLNK